MIDEALWKRELLDWLLGRLSKQKSAGDIAPHTDNLVHRPIALWWMLEGKRYGFLDGAIAQNWPSVAAHVRSLLATYNADWRESERPLGEVDWTRTMTRAVGSTRPLYVSQASRAGLLDEERAALLGWAAWISDEWRQYAAEFALPDMSATSDLPKSGRDAGTPLQRWAHVARRSKWPFLRFVVAESLRVLLEPQELDQLPLPADRPTLFELLCLKRIAQSLVPDAARIRWLTNSGDNEIQVGPLRCQFQRSLGRERVLAYGGYEPELAEAIRSFDVSVPARTDVWVRFGSPINGFEGILVEAKSGTQEYGAAVEQLRVYRNTIRAHSRGRLLVWGITETGCLRAGGEELIRRQTSGVGCPDVWAFSGPDDVARVLAVCELAGPRAVDDHPASGPY